MLKLATPPHTLPSCFKYQLRISNVYISWIYCFDFIISLQDVVAVNIDTTKVWRATASSSTSVKISMMMYDDIIIYTYKTI